MHLAKLYNQNIIKYINNNFSPRQHGQVKKMKKSIDSYVQAIAHDYKDVINENEYDSISEYIITEAEDAFGYNEFFDDNEVEDNGGEPTSEQIEELKDYLKKNYNYLP